MKEENETKEYLTARVDLPGLDKLEELIDEHKTLIIAVENNMREINKAISKYRLIITVKETVGDNQ